MRQRVRGAVRLKHLNASGLWPSGNARYYYRPKGKKGIPLPDLPPDDPGFLRAYADATTGKPAQKHQHPSGTLGAAVVAYLASDAYLSLAKSSRAIWRRKAKDIEARYGEATLASLRPVHIKSDLANFEPHPANNRLKVWRSMCYFWCERGLIETNPARDVSRRKTPKARGATPWTRQDFETFRKHWPIGTQQRATFELLYATCAAIVDVVRLGRHNIEGGWLSYERQKSGSMGAAPFTAEPPEWFEASPHLHDALAEIPQHMTFLTTHGGRSRSAKAAAAWFSKACDAAGLPGLSSHGIRKGRAAIFRENGASPDQRMAILGHETKQEAHNYSKSADLKKIISGTEKFQQSEKLELPSENIKENKGFAG